MKRIEFLNPVGLSGVFSSVRLAESWPELEPGEEVELVGPKEGGSETMGYAKATDQWVGDLALVPGSILELEQQPLHRTYSGLTLGLKCAGGAPGLAQRVTPKAKAIAVIFHFTRSSSILRAVKG